MLLRVAHFCCYINLHKLKFCQFWEIWVSSIEKEKDNTYRLERECLVVLYLLFLFTDRKYILVSTFLCVVFFSYGNIYKETQKKEKEYKRTEVNYLQQHKINESSSFSSHCIQECMKKMHYWICPHITQWKLYSLFSDWWKNRSNINDAKIINIHKFHKFHKIQYAPWLMQMISLSAVPVVVDLIVYCIYVIPLLDLMMLLLILRKQCTSNMGNSLKIQRRLY